MSEITLYSRDNAGNILSWECTVVNKGTSVSLYMNRGRVDGARQISYENNIVGKQGRSDYEQGESRLTSRANKKKRGGYIQLTDEQQRHVDTYTDNIDKINYLQEFIPQYREDADGNAKPMKAAQYYRKKPNWTDPYGVVWKDRKYFYILNPSEPKEKGAVVAKFPMIGQPKINGVRGLLKRVGDKVLATSKDGLPYKAISHITDWCEDNLDIFGEEGETLLDGEFYIEGEPLQIIQSAVKSFDFNTPRVVFVLFDLAIPDFTNIERWQHIKNEIRLDLNSPIERIKTFKVRSDEEAQRLCDKFISQGYEGIILRDREAMYGFGSRRNNMLKLKRTISEDFTIVRIIPQPKGELGMFVCKHKGKEFKVNPTFSDSEKALLLLHPSNYIGKKLQTTFYEWTMDEKPLHIIEPVIRDYE